VEGGVVEGGAIVLERFVRRVASTLGVSAATIALASAATAEAATATSYTGTTTDGATWIADVPSPWNGTLLLYSHGFGPPIAADAPDPATKQALLDRGYALAGSSYDPNGSWWALDSALTDQFQTLNDVQQDLPSKPEHVIAFGTSMGGLISSLEAEHARGRLDAALTTCGIVAGAIQLNNYQLDGEYAMSRLLAPNESIKLVNFTGPGEGLQTGQQLDAVAQQAQTTAAGRARLALAMGFMNVATWAAGESMPAAGDYATQEQEQYDVQFKPSNPPPIATTMDFVEFGRPYIEQAAGGNGSWTKGVDFARLLAHSSYAPEVINLYRAAHLDLRRDLDTLTRNANITADPAAIRSLQRTSVPTGRLQVPELDMHTISDQLVPVQHENYYRHTVERAGARKLLRQAFVERQLHCNFTPAELVAGVLTVQQRIDRRHWGNLAEPARLNATATSLGLGDAAFIRYEPPRLSGDNGPFSFRGRWWHLVP
jgi:pimeloyl-ACP methyl ester carboxylesterase